MTCLKCESEISDDDTRSKFWVSYLSRMGGATIDDAVRRLMQTLLSFAVGSELNRVGQEELQEHSPPGGALL